MKKHDSRAAVLSNLGDDDRGIGIIMAVITAGVLFGFLGLCFDLGRILIAQNELQTYVDSATLAATLELDGTDEGVDRARQAAIDTPNRWVFGTKVVPSPEVYFAEAVGGPWVADPPVPPTNYRFARVKSEGPVTLYFLPLFGMLTGASGTADGGAVGAATLGPVAALGPATLETFDVAANSGAGQLRPGSFSQGLLPYSPIAHLDPGRPVVTNPGYAGSDPFNFEIGRRYTMRWPPPGQRSNDLEGRCEGDIFDPNAGELLFDPPMQAAERGFIDIGKPLYNITGANGSAFIRQAIVSNTQSHGLVVGEPIVHVFGQRSTEDAALRERISQDSDPHSPTYAEYLANTDLYGNVIANGRRIVFMPVNNAYDEDKVVEFATFFLPPEDEVCCPEGPGMCGNGQGGGSGGNGNGNGGNGGGGNNSPKPCCAEYIGSGILYGIRNAASDKVGIYVPRLTQ